MPCPPPKSLSEPSKADSLKAESEHRATQKDAFTQRVVNAHLAGDSHAVLMERFGLTRPRLTRILQSAGLDGKSAKARNEVVGGDTVPAAPVDYLHGYGGRILPRGVCE